MTHNKTPVISGQLPNGSREYGDVYMSIGTCTCCGAGWEPAVGHFDCQNPVKAKLSCHLQVHRACLPPESVVDMNGSIRERHLMYSEVVFQLYHGENASGIPILAIAPRHEIVVEVLLRLHMTSTCCSVAVCCEPHPFQQSMPHGIPLHAL